MRCYNAAMSDEAPSIEELLARLIKLEEERAELLAENSRKRLELLPFSQGKKRWPTSRRSPRGI